LSPTDFHHLHAVKAAAVWNADQAIGNALSHTRHRPGSSSLQGLDTMCWLAFATATFKEIPQEILIIPLSRDVQRRGDP
jgi:hypothetical protein